MPRRPFPTNNVNGDGRAMKFLRPIFRLQRRFTKSAPLLREMSPLTASGMSHRDAIAHMARKYRRLLRGRH